MLEKDFKYYIDNQADFVKKYSNKYLIIKDQAVVEVFDTKNEAYFEAQKKYELGTFLLQYCAAGNMFYTQTFHTQNVSF